MMGARGRIAIRLGTCVLVVVVLGSGAFTWNRVAAPTRWPLHPHVRRIKPLQLSGFPKPFAMPLAGVGPADYVELRRTACYGGCPAYTVRISGDGTVLWKGDFAVEVTGNVTGRINPSAARELIARFRRKGFWWLWSGYSDAVFDVPTYHTVVSIAGRTKEVMDHADVAPAWLRAMDGEIDEAAGTQRWIEGDIVLATQPEPK